MRPLNLSTEALKLAAEIASSKNQRFAILLLRDREAMKELQPFIEGGRLSRELLAFLEE